MQVQVKLMGALKKKTPVDGKLDLPEDATIADALKVLNISRSNVQVVSINGSFERDLDRTLDAGDEMTVLAPVGGG